MGPARRRILAVCGLLALCLGPAEAPPVAAGAPLAWQLGREQLGGHLAFAHAPDGDFTQVFIRPDLEFFGWDGRLRRAEYLGGGQFYLYEPGDQVPTRTSELRFLDWEDQQCRARVEYGEFTVIKPPRPTPPPPAAPPSAAAGSVQLQVVPIENPPVVYRGARLDVRSASGRWSAVLAEPSGTLPPPHERGELPQEPREVLPESAAFAMATAQMTRTQMLQMIQQQIERSQPPQDPPPAGVAVRACLFDAPNFGGRSLCVNAGEKRRDLAKAGSSGADASENFALRIASLRIDGGPAQVTLYAQPGLTGDSVKIAASSADLASSQFAGRARSLEVESVAPQPGPSDPGIAYFFSDDAYQGYLFHLRAGDAPLADLRPSGQDDAISSLRIEGDAKVALYADLFYRGRELWKADGTTSLGRSDAFDDRTSSLQVVRASAPADSPTPQVTWTVLHAPNGDWTQAHRDSVINYVTWGGGEWTAAYLGGGRFRHTQRGATQSRESIGMNYVDWKGSEWTATVEGEKFRHTRRDGRRDELDRTMNYTTWGGGLWSAKLVPPAAVHE
jgi:hypothetical protein